MSEPLRFSALRTLGQRSPAHMIAANEVDTPSTELGAAVHAIVFGTQAVIEYPGKQRRGREWDDFEAANSHAQIVNASTYDKAHAMAEAVLAHEYAKKALTGTIEKTLLWECVGVPCRSTPDCFAPLHVADLKCVRSSDPKRFPGQALSMAWPSQLSFYAEAIRTLGLGDPAHHYLVAVESTKPYPVVVYQMSDRCKEAAEKLWRSWFEKYLVCRATGVFPGYCDAVQEIDVPEEIDYSTVFGDAEEAVEEAA